MIKFENVWKKYRLKTLPYRTLREDIVSFTRRLNPSFWSNRVPYRDQRTQSDFWALEDVNFKVHEGEALGIIGPNAAGKTTILKIIAGITYPTKGKITTRGKIGSLIEIGAGIHPELTGRENIYLYGSIIGLSRREIRQKFQNIVEFAELGRFIDEPVKHYSQGMEMRLGFSVTIHLNPDILLIDEVLAVGDARFYQKSLEAMAQVIKGGHTVVFVAHNLAAISSFCDRVLLLEKGKIISEGLPQDVILLYKSRLSESKRLGTIGTRPINQWGTGDIVIKEVKFLQEGRWVAESTTPAGGSWGFRMEYESSQRIDYPVFGMVIHNTKGEVVYGENNGIGKELVPYVEGEGAVIFKTPSLSLPPGKYLLSVCVHNPGATIVYDWHEQAYTFELTETKPVDRVGHVYLASSWEHLPQGS
jgi:ABC-type polysaccharide/polyol phosphate transport system ATPase subunit